MRSKMLKESSNSVKVRYLEGTTILAQLRRAAQAIKQDKNVVKVYLFGSFVRGDYVPGSDADVCVVLRSDDRRIIDRIPQYLDCFDDVGVPVDVFPYTEQELETMKRSGNRFVMGILGTGIEL